MYGYDISICPKCGKAVRSLYNKSDRILCEIKTIKHGSRITAATNMRYGFEAYEAHRCPILQKQFQYQNSKKS